MLSSGVGSEVSFECFCGTKNKRKANYLRSGQIINCINYECSESYEVFTENDEFMFERRAFYIECKCKAVHAVPKKLACGLKKENSLFIDCGCGSRTQIKWMLSKQVVTQLDSA